MVLGGAGGSGGRRFAPAASRGGGGPPEYTENGAPGLGSRWVLAGEGEGATANTAKGSKRCGRGWKWALVGEGQIGGSDEELLAR